jgi:hypothetical protein
MPAMRLATGTFGRSNIRATRREPHSGHLSRLSRLEIGNAAPRVHTSVLRSSSSLPRPVADALHGLLTAPGAPDVNAPAKQVGFADGLHSHHGNISGTAAVIG